MCSGAVLLYKIPKVIIGENRTLRGSEEYLRPRGVDVTVLDNDECVRLIEEFIGNNRALGVKILEKRVYCCFKAPTIGHLPYTGLRGRPIGQLHPHGIDEADEIFCCEPRMHTLQKQCTKTSQH
jgi:hypothetical protein